MQTDVCTYYSFVLIQDKINVWNLGGRNMLSRGKIVCFAPGQKECFVNLKFILHFLSFCFGFPHQIIFWVGSKFGTWLGVFHRKKIHLFIVKLSIIWHEQTENLDKLLKVLAMYLLLPAVILDVAFNTVSSQCIKRSNFLKVNLYFTVCLGIQESVFKWDRYFGILLISSGVVH